MSSRSWIRARDPLSPFLFIIVAEGFECFAKNLMDCHRFSRVKVGVGNTMISHLRFADDTLIFGKVNWKNV